MPELSRQRKREFTTQRKCQECWTRTRMISDKDWTLARARRLMKQRVSSDHLPHTSTIRGGTLAMWDSINAQGRDQNCVNGQLSPVENGQPLCDHFKVTTVNTTQRSQVQFPHENVGGDTNSSLNADACRSRLMRESAKSTHLVISWKDSTN